MSRLPEKTYPGGLTESQFNDRMETIRVCREQAVASWQDAPRGHSIKERVASLFDCDFARGCRSTA
jgi:hypothetical protein